jgi:hypothetical protein
MSAFDLDQTLERARVRLASPRGRRRRSDAGKLRLSPTVIARLRPLLLGLERPKLSVVQRTLEAQCRRDRQRPPARATLYNALPRVACHEYQIRDLPAQVRRALYNLSDAGTVPGHQLAFYCFNYGDLAAASFAAGLPWLDLYQAARLPGWRPRSRGLLDATVAARGIL